MISTSSSVLSALENYIGNLKSIMEPVVTRHFRDSASDTIYPSKGPRVRAEKCTLPSAKHLLERKIEAVLEFERCGFLSRATTAQEISRELPNMVTLTREFVYHGAAVGGYQVIIKVNTENYKTVEFERELELGREEINDLRLEYPNFMYTFGTFKCPHPKQTSIGHTPCLGKEPEVEYMALEYVLGGALNKVILNLSEEQLVSIYLQLMYSLHAARKGIGFTHGDLHPGNVMLSRYGADIIYETENGKEVFSTDMVAVLIDYGRSSTTERPRGLHKGKPYNDVLLFIDRIFNSIRQWFKSTAKKTKRTISQVLSTPKYKAYAGIARSIFALISGFLKDKSRERMIELMSGSEAVRVEVPVTYLDLAANLRSIYNPRYIQPFK